MSARITCRHPADHLHVEFVNNRRYDWRVQCSCGTRWRPEVPNIPAHVEKYVSGVAAQRTWHGPPLDYRED